MGPDVNSPLFLSPDDWLELASAVNFVITDLERTYGDDLDESQEAYKARLLALCRTIGPDGAEAANRGTRWIS